MESGSRRFGCSDGLAVPLDRWQSRAYSCRAPRNRNHAGTDDNYQWRCSHAGPLA